MKPLPTVLKPCRGRLGDIMRSLFQVARGVCPDAETSLTALIEGQQEGARVRKAESHEAGVIEAVQALASELVPGNPCLGLPTEAITKAFNKDRPEKKQLNAYIIGKILRELGFKPWKSRDGKHRGVAWDADLIDRLAEDYGLQEPPGPPEQPSETSNASNPILTDGLPLYGSPDETSSQPSSKQPLDGGLGGSPGQASSPNQLALVGLDGSDGLGVAPEGEGTKRLVTFQEGPEVLLSLQEFRPRLEALLANPANTGGGGSPEGIRHFALESAVNAFSSDARLQTRARRVLEGYGVTFRVPPAQQGAA